MVFKFDRDWYALKGPNVVKSEYPGVTFYMQTSQSPKGPQYVLQAFLGKQAKPAYYYWYKNPEARGAKMEETLKSVARSLEYKAQRAAERKSQDAGLEVGDVVVASWGYEQTNVDAYQVVAKMGKNKVTLREVALERVNPETDKEAWDGPMSQYVKPVKGAFLEKGETFSAMARGGSVKVKDGVAYARKWDGARGFYNSWYG